MDKDSYMPRHTQVLREFVSENKIRPIYDVPERVVYQFWLDDCHC